MKFWAWAWENFVALLFLLVGAYLMIFAQDYESGRFALIMGSIGLVLGEVRSLREELKAKEVDA